jgi:hypothetical protein
MSERKAFVIHEGLLFFRREQTDGDRGVEWPWPGSSRDRHRRVAMIFKVALPETGAGDAAASAISADDAVIKPVSRKEELSPCILGFNQMNDMGFNVPAVEGKVRGRGK